MKFVAWVRAHGLVGERIPTKTAAATTTTRWATLGLGQGREAEAKQRDSDDNNSKSSIASHTQGSLIATPDSLAPGHHEQKPRRVNDRRAGVSPDRVDGGKRIRRHLAQEVSHRSLRKTNTYQDEENTHKHKLS